MTGYVENEDFVPNITDIHQQFNTSGLGAHHDPALVSPVFEADRLAVAEQIVNALDPDHSEPEANVILPKPQVVTEHDPDADREALTEVAQARLDAGPEESSRPATPAGGDSNPNVVSPAKKAAAKKTTASK